MVNKTIRIDRNGQTEPTNYTWQEGMGNDHAYQLHRSDVCEHIKMVHDELGIKSIRCHGVFDDDMLTVQRMSDYRMFRSVPGSKKIKEVNFRQVGHVYDNLLAAGVKPFVELSFMPSALASGKKLGLRYDPNITMPKSLSEWDEYITEFITFLINRYGRSEVESWKFEVWNEPDGAWCWKHGVNGKEYGEFVAEDAKIRKFVKKKLYAAGISYPDITCGTGRKTVR